MTEEQRQIYIEHFGPAGPDIVRFHLWSLDNVHVLIWACVIGVAVFILLRSLALSFKDVSGNPFVRTFWGFVSGMLKVFQWCFLGVMFMLVTQTFLFAPPA